jgi:GGDEF domain-containing protein
LFPFALNEARQSSGCFLAVLPIERFSVYQSRFGTQVAKDIFDYFAQYMRQRLQPTDQIFCWADGVVLAIISRTVGLDSVRAEFMRLGLQKIEQTVPLGGGRSFNLSMSSNFAVLGVEKGATNEQLIHKVDNLLLVNAKSR